MFSYDPSNRILKVQKLAEEEVDLGLLEYQKESYQKYLTEKIYSDMEYLLQVMRELLQVSQVDAEFRVGDLYCGNYKNEVKKKSPSYYPVYAKFTIDGAVFPNEVEVFRIPAMDEDGILNFHGDRRVLLMQMVAAERVSYAADKQTVSTWGERAVSKSPAPMAAGKWPFSTGPGRMCWPWTCVWARPARPSPCWITPSTPVPAAVWALRGLGQDWSGWPLCRINGEDPARWKNV